MVIYCPTKPTRLMLSISYSGGPFFKSVPVSVCPGGVLRTVCAKLCLDNQPAPVRDFRLRGYASPGRTPNLNTPCGREDAS